MPAPVAQVYPSMKEGEHWKLEELHQEEIQHDKVCHVHWQSAESTKVGNNKLVLATIVIIRLMSEFYCSIKHSIVCLLYFTSGSTVC